MVVCPAKRRSVQELDTVRRELGCDVEYVDSAYSCQGLCLASGIGRRDQRWRVEWTGDFVELTHGLSGITLPMSLVSARYVAVFLSASGGLSVTVAVVV